MALLIAVLQSRGGISRGISFSKSIHQPQHFLLFKKEGKKEKQKYPPLPQQQKQKVKTKI